MLVSYFRRPPAGVVAEPNQIAFVIGYLSWNVDFGRSGSSGFVGCFLRLRWSSCIPVPRGRSCRIVSVDNGFGQPSGVVAVVGGVNGGVGDIDGDLVEVV